MIIDAISGVGGGGGGTTIVQKPTVSVGTYTYDGTAQGPTITWDAGMADNCVVTNATKTDAGTYTLTIALKNASKMIWDDFTTADLTYEYTIQKADQTITLSSNAVTLDPEHLTSTVTISGAQGTISVTSSDASIATATVNGSAVTISNVSETSGNATITVSAAATTNYEGATASISVICAFVQKQTFTVTLDLADSNPDTWCTRTEGTVTEVSPGGGENEIDELMGYYPCMLLNGVEGVKLNPNNYAKDVDGNDVDITSGNAGDVMVKFPSRGYKISKSGTTLTISITSDPNKFGYKYPTYKGTKVQAFYHSAYEGYTSGNKLRSLSGKTLTANQTIGTFRTQAQANGTGYEQRTFNEFTYLQCCALIKYKGKNMQTALGRGFVDGNSAAVTTGGTNTRGLNYGETTGKVQMKLFGIEDFWGNVFDFVDGIFSNANRQIQVADGNFNDTGSGYTTVGASFSSNISGYLRDIIGTNDGGFAPASQSYGSATTYFCDYVNVGVSRLAAFGGGWDSADAAGLFRLYVNRAASDAYADYGSRLTYLKVKES